MITIFSDGAQRYRKNGQRIAHIRAGGAVLLKDGAEVAKIAVKLPKCQSSYEAEVTVAAALMQVAAQFGEVELFCDCQDAVYWLQHRLQGTKLPKGKSIRKMTVVPAETYISSTKRGLCRINYVKGHGKSANNILADMLARQGADGQETDENIETACSRIKEILENL